MNINKDYFDTSESYVSVVLQSRSPLKRESLRLKVLRGKCLYKVWNHKRGHMRLNLDNTEESAI